MNAVRTWTSVLVVAMALTGCGGSQPTREAGTTTTADAAVPSSTTGPAPTLTSLASSCAPGTSPALASYSLDRGEPAWWYCSAELAWREIVGSSPQIVLLTSLTEDTTGNPPAQQHDAVALLASSGSELWRRELAGGGSFGLWGRPPGPIAAGDIVVLPIDTGGTTTIIGVDATTGAERWRVDPASIPGTSGTLGPIANTEDMTILATDHTVTGLDRRTGTTRWTIPFTIVDSSQVGVSRATSAVATSDTSTMIVLPTIETPEPGLHPPGSLPPTITYLSVAIDTEDGTERWRAPVLHHPAAADGTVVGYIYEASPPPTIDAPVSLPPMRRPVLQALDADDGTTLWTAAGAPTYGDLWPVGDGIVITTVGTDAAGRTTAYDLRSGAVRWEQPIDPGNYLGAPQTIEGHRSFLLGGGRLSALDTATGSTMWSTATPPGSLESYLTADRARVLVSFNTMPWRD